MGHLLQLDSYVYIAKRVVEKCSYRAASVLQRLFFLGEKPVCRVCGSIRVKASQMPS